uniref:Target of myb1 membrane trafficking protein n=1 Tax=Oryzias latipes TaxID=8090 RepID=A0A3P9MKD3_ORYLA
MDFLIGNPFSTPVGQRIERATSGSLQAEDWGLNLEICDIINETDEGPKDAVKAIKKRIVGNKNFREIMLALTVLETCVKNCGHRFHALVATQDFVEGVLVRSILPKYNPPTILHDRVLSLIQSWADAFRTNPSLSGVVYVYDDLRRRGLEFPMTDLDALSPIHTPNRVNRGPAQPLGTWMKCMPLQTKIPFAFKVIEKQKLRSDLEMVKANLTVMSALLNELAPGHSKPDDIQLLQQLFSVCKKMQTRVVELIPQLLDEGFIAELLTINDDLNNTFIRYERFSERADAFLCLQSSAESPSLLEAKPSADKQPAVIPTTSQPAVSSQSGPQPAACHRESAEEFDMFAQTRGSSLAEQRKSVKYEDPGAVEGLAEALDSRLQVTAGVRMCVWLPTRHFMVFGARLFLYAQHLSFSEFDKFLEDRVKAVERSGQTVCSAPASTARPPPSGARQQGTSHDQLFSL